MHALPMTIQAYLDGGSHLSLPHPLEVLYRWEKEARNPLPFTLWAQLMSACPYTGLDYQSTRAFVQDFILTECADLWSLATVIRRVDHVDSLRDGLQLYGTLYTERELISISKRAECDTSQ